MIIQKMIKSVLKDRINDLRPVPSDDRPRAAIIFALSDSTNAASAIVDRFSKEGLKTYSVAADVSLFDEGIAIELRDITAESISNIFRQVLADDVVIDVVIVTGDRDKHQPFLEMDVDDLYSDWARGCLAHFYIAQNAISTMQRNKRGTLLFEGAGYSIEPESGYAGASSIRTGVRMLSQSLAREFGPKGIHVAHVVGSKSEAGEINPNIYWSLYNQHKTAWTQEVISL